MGSGRTARRRNEGKPLRFRSRTHFPAFEARRKASTSVTPSDALFHGTHNHGPW